MGRRRLVLLAAAACACSCSGSEGIDPHLTPADLWIPVVEEAPPPLPDGVRVRVGSLNLHGGQEASAEAIGAFFATLELDVLVLQECPDEYVRPIADTSGLVNFAYANGLAILSHVPLEGLERVELRAGRAFARVTAMIDGVLFSIYSVHIGWNAEGDLQARELVDEHLALDPTPHLIVAGDFNDEHFSSQNNILEEVLADAWTSLGIYPGERISWPATTFDGSEGSQLIDLIFTRRALPAIVVRGDIVNLSPVISDHKPVYAELLFPRSAVPFVADPFAPLRDVWRSFPPVAEHPLNLLRNDGAEEGLAGWTVSGDPEAVAARGNQAPHGGGSFFTGYLGNPRDGTLRSSGTQRIELPASAGELLVSGWMTTGFVSDPAESFISNIVRPYDEGELIVEIFDASERVLARETSKRRDTLAWNAFARVIALPPGAQSAALTWMSHRKPTSGEDNDAAFDDLYLAHRPSVSPSKLSGGNFVTGAGAESGDLSAWENDTWRAAKSGEAVTLMLFPPQSFSGEYFFLGASGSRMSQDFDISAFDELNIHFGGWFRTYLALGSVSISVEVLDADRQVWGVLEPPPVRFAEWTQIDARARIPRGATALRLVISAAELSAGEMVFADELYLFPEVFSEAP